MLARWPQLPLPASNAQHPGVPEGGEGVLQQKRAVSQGHAGANVRGGGEQPVVPVRCMPSGRYLHGTSESRLPLLQIDDYAGWLQKTEASAIDHAWHARFNRSRSADDAGGRSRRRGV